MRARYYSPELRRFINADIIPGKLSNAITLNRYAYANGNPVSFVDPFGLEAARGNNADIMGYGYLPSLYGLYAPQIPKLLKYPTGQYLTIYTPPIVAPAIPISPKVLDAIFKAKEKISNAYDTAVEWIEDVGEPVFETIQDIDDWLEENNLKDLALHDSERQGNPDAFYEKILFGGISGPSLDLKEGNIGIGSAEINFYGAGYDWEYVDLALFDIGHAEASLEMKKTEFSASLFASIWSPSISVSIGKLTIGVSAEVGAIGYDFNLSKHEISAKAAYGWGASLSLSWE